MTSSLVHAESLLVIDVGSTSTKAVLFDVVDGRYRFLASGIAPTTAGAPFLNISEGVRMAVDRVQHISGRQLIDSNENLMIPSAPDGSGVDAFAATISAGKPLRIVAVGLLENVSVESVRHLATSMYGKLIETISLNDRRKQDTRINLIQRARPDLIIMAGGTENGASQSVLRLLEAVGLACFLTPAPQRPDVLFVGNQALQEEIKANLERSANLYFAPNIRPALEMEQLEPAQIQMWKVYSRIRGRQILGVEELNRWAGGKMLPTSAAFGRLVRFLSKAHSTHKGVLGIDVGASATTLAAAFDGDLALKVYPQFGLGNTIAESLNQMPLREITRWLKPEITDETVRDYLYNKSLYPSGLPYSPEELEIEQAVARQAMQYAVKMAVSAFPTKAVFLGDGLLPLVEPVVATGSVLTQAPSLAQSALMLLDGLQPTGVTTLVLDQNQIASAIGVAAGINPLLAVQLLDSSSFLHLGTVISPVGNARFGTPILRLKMVYESGHEMNVDLKQGALEVLPLPNGQSARLQLQPLQRFDVGMGSPGRGGSLRVMGGVLGVILDARGRPLSLPADRAKFYALNKKWLSTLGGQK